MTVAIKNIDLKYAQPKMIEPKRMPFLAFYKKYIDPVTSAVASVKYEYDNGYIEKTTSNLIFYN